MPNVRFNRESSVIKHKYIKKSAPLVRTFLFWKSVKAKNLAIKRLRGF